MLPLNDMLNNHTFLLLYHAMKAATRIGVKALSQNDLSLYFSLSSYSSAKDGIQIHSRGLFNPACMRHAVEHDSVGSGFMISRDTPMIDI
jgi:hypothetical protein